MTIMRRRLDMKTQRLVVNRGEAVANIDRYERELAALPALQAVMSYARAWHGYQASDRAWRIAPSKFVGYADNDALTYLQLHKQRDGRRTERALAAWSEDVEAGSAAHHDMLAAVLHLFAQYGRTPNKLIHLSRLGVERPVGEGAAGRPVRPAATAPRNPRITFDAGICGGRPTIRGMRIRVSDVLGMLAAGATRAEVLADFPYLEDQDITAALEYAAETAGHRIIRAA